MKIIKKCVHFYSVLLMLLLSAVFNNHVYSFEAEKLTGQRGDKNLSSMIGRAIYNLDEEQLMDVVRGYLKDHDEIKGLEITDEIGGDFLLTYFRKDDGEVYGKVIPDEIRALKHVEEKVMFNDEIVGTVDIYYYIEEEKLLNAEEKKWLREHAVIWIAVTKNRKPFDNVTEKGHYSGLHDDLLKMLNRKLGSNLKAVVFDNWNIAYKKAEEGEVDGIMGLRKTRSTEKNFLFSSAYHNIPADLITRSDYPEISSWAALNDSMIWVLKNSSLIPMIEKELPDAQILEADSELLALSQLSVGVGDAFVAWSSATDDELGRLELTKVLTIDSSNGDLFIGINRSQPVIASIIAKGLNAISLRDLEALRRHWLEDSDSSITSEEERWLQANPITRVAVVHEWTPYDMTSDKGIHTGLHSDIAAEINRLMGIQLVLAPYKNWETAFQKAASGEVDAIMGLSWSSKIAEIFHFSKPYHFMPYQLITRLEEDGINNLDDMSGKVLWVAKGTIYEKMIPEDYPDIEVKTAKDSKALMQKIISGKGDAFLGEDMDRQLLPAGLKASPDFYLDEGHLHFGIHKSRPLVASIINKGLNLISRKRMTEIKNRWFNELSSSVELTLTIQEKNWLKSHPKWTVANEVDWPPFDFAVDGNPLGFSIDIVKLAAERVGAELEFINGYTWVQLMEQFKTGKIDILPALFKTKARENFIAFTYHYAANPSIMVVHSDDRKTNSIDDLNGKRVGAIKGYANTEVLTADYPDIKLVFVKDTSEGLKSVSVGNADAYIGSLGPISYLLEKEFIPNIRIVGDSGLFKPEDSYIYMGVARERENFRNILQKGIDTITVEEYQKIRKKWLPFVDTAIGEKTFVQLTRGEQRWLAEQGDLTLGVNPSWPPFDFINKKGFHSGVGAGYAELVASRLGINMTLQTDLSWAEVITKVKAGEIDILPAVVRKPEHEPYLSFTKPFASFPFVIATRKDAPFINDLKGLEGKSVGVVKNNIIQDQIATDYNELEIVMVATLAQGLEGVNSGRLDAFVDNLATITHEIDRLHLDDLKIAAPTAYKMELAMAVRKELSDLVPLLDKALDTVNEREKSSIINSWIAVKVKFGLDVKTVLLWVVPGTFCVLIVISIIVIWNRRLGREIDDRKKAQAKLTEAHEKLEDAFYVISESITYASRIQRSVLPHTDYSGHGLFSYFILWKPRDVVGGDIYWMKEWGEGTCIVLGDCTGHGVPGAFMTLIANGAFERAIDMVEVGDCGELISQMHKSMQSSLGQDEETGDSDDGIELGVVYFPNGRDSLNFAGARFSLFYHDTVGKVTEIKGDKKGVAYRRIPYETTFTSKRVEWVKGRRFIMTTDGFFDQVGGDKRRMMGKNRFKKLLLNIRELPIENVGEKLYRDLSHTGVMKNVGMISL